MKRIIKFTPADADHFEWLWRGLILGAGGQRREERTADVMRRDRTLVKKMKLISVVKLGEDGKPEKMAQTGEDIRVLKFEGDETKVLEIFQVDVDQINRYIENTPWLVTASESAFDALDFINASERVEK